MQVGLAIAPRFFATKIDWLLGLLQQKVTHFNKQRNLWGFSLVESNVSLGMAQLG